MVQKLKDLNQFIENDLWTVKLNSLSKGRAFWYRQLRIAIITYREFTRDNCAEKASALTYFSVLSIVPVIAMAFGIATIFGLNEYLNDEIDNYFSAQREVLDYAQGFADNMLSNSNGGVISGISAVFLIYAVLKLFNRIEGAFNDIWNTPKGRSIKRKITDYMSVILLGPLVLVLSSSTAVFLTTSIETLTSSVEILDFLKPLIVFVLNLVPYTLIWLLLFLIYLVFPNTSVKIKPALIAGIFAGTAYQLVQFAWINGQVYLTSYNAVYSTFAALPLFLIWLQLSWTIVLFGGELAYAIQNVNSWSYDNDGLILHHKARRKLTILVLRRIVLDFTQNDSSVDFDILCDQLNVPRRFVTEAITDLLDAKLIVKVVKENDLDAYQPSFDINKLDIHSSFNRLDSFGRDSLPGLDQNEGYDQIEKLIGQIDEQLKSSPVNVKIKDL